MGMAYMRAKPAQIFRRFLAHIVADLVVLACILLLINLFLPTANETSANAASSSLSPTLIEALWQLLGWGVIAIPLLMILLVIPIFLRARNWRRTAFLLFLTLIGSWLLLTGLSFWPKPANWPYFVGIGGYLGELGKQLIMSVERLGLVMPRWFASMLSLTLSAWLFWQLLGIHASHAHALSKPVKGLVLTTHRTLPFISSFLRWSVHRPLTFTAQTILRLLRHLWRERTKRPRTDPEYDFSVPDATAAGPIAPDSDRQAEMDLEEEFPQFLVNSRMKQREQELEAANGGNENSDPGEFEVSMPAYASASPVAATKKPSRKKTDFYQPPELELLAPPSARQNISNQHDLRASAQKLEGILADFGLKGHIMRARPGPVITLFEFEPAAGIKASRVVALAEDVARAMAVPAARIAPVPSRSVIGIEIPNDVRYTVFLRALLGSEQFYDQKTALPIAIGETIDGQPFIADLAITPHLLIAGTTGAGKSVGVNAMILSLMYRLSPEECRFILIDPKILELKVYDGSPHLLAPVVTEPKDAVGALKWAVREMEDRYQRMARIGVRNIRGFNDKVGRSPGLGRKIPYLVVVIDEMADLMLVAGKEIEALVQRLAQMARAAGIHLITATQRPSVDVITGTIKANFPSRVSYAVTSKIDSRTILGEQGAEQLLGKGDLLFMKGGSKIRRLHGPFVSDEEVETVVAHLKSMGEPEYEDILSFDDGEPIPGMPTSSTSANSGDKLYDKAVAVVLEDRRASTSYVQRRLQIGYNKAATLIERMEAEDVISAADRTGKRNILIPNRAEGAVN